METTLDVSGLPPPEPFERILEALVTLAPGDQLRVRHRREPHPLYQALQTMGYRWHTRKQGEAAFEILIWPDSHVTPKGRPERLVRVEYPVVP